MPAAPTNAKEFVALVVRSKLVSADGIRDAIAHFKPTGKDADDLEAIRRALIAGKHLTEYQAALLMRGHAEGFFLGPYKVLELIAKGRMAGVYKAVHESGQLVAIKVLPASKAKDPETLARFKREAKLLTKLDHPNVVRAFHYGESAGKHFLVLEYIESDTLEEILQKRKRLPPVEAVHIVHQAMLGLQHIHERGMIHRNIEPATLMLVSDQAPGDATATSDWVKISDIGLGKSVFVEGEKSELDDPSQLTTDGALIGTPDYMAPEQARSVRNADIRSDIYSLGCVLYHALTGQPPFPDKSVLNQVIRHATEQPRPLSDFMSKVPDGLQNVLSWMMAKDPSQRYASPEKAAQALQLFLHNMPAGKSAPRVVPAYFKWLETSPDADPGRTPAVPANIPMGKLETPARKVEPAKPVEARKPASVPVAVPAATPAPPPPAAVPAMRVASIDVELIPIPAPAAVNVKKADDEKRGLMELNQRDAIMLVAGALLVALAVTAGWGLSQLFRGKPAPEQPPAAPALSPPEEG